MSRVPTVTPEMKAERDRMVWMSKRLAEAPSMPLDRLKDVERIYRNPFTDSESTREKTLRLELLDALWRRRRVIRDERVAREVHARENAPKRYKGVKR